MKEYLRVDDTSLDGTIGGLITAGRQYCENFQNRAYLTQTWDLTLDGFPDAAMFPAPSWQMERVYNFPYSLNRFPGKMQTIRFPRAPLKSVSFIKFTDTARVETTWAASNYVVDPDSEPGRLVLATGVSWPNIQLQPIAGVRIQYICGYGDVATAVPQNVKQAIMIWAAHRFENPASDDVPDAAHNLLWQDRLVDF